MKNLMIVTCLHGRLSLAEKAFKNWKTVCSRAGVNLLIMAGVSTDQERNFCIRNNASFALIPNEPLGQKWNAALLCALRIPEAFDQFMIMGSDDFLHQDFFSVVNFAQNHQGFSSLLITNGKKVVRINENPGAVVGAARIVSRRALKDVYLKCQCFFDLNATRGLDTFINNRLIQSGYFPKIHQGPNVFICDYKTKNNIWKFETFSRWPEVSMDLLRKFPFIDVSLEDNEPGKANKYTESNPVSSK